MAFTIKMNKKTVLFKKDTRYVMTLNKIAGEKLTFTGSDMGIKGMDMGVMLEQQFIEFLSQGDVSIFDLNAKLAEVAFSLQHTVQLGEFVDWLESLSSEELLDFTLKVKNEVLPEETKTLTISAKPTE